ncbi:hypothetical protein Tsubulata_031782 [Turnera subulata]|uniref:CHY-type domain-containing protein n=1 Tax=Turnera subulata TaxID=218843 RepID=A0A9Q0FWE6_9ROSI|nr:hypothetical protein Tsubulata_031782 [Turnera subulata]
MAEVDIKSFMSEELGAEGSQRMAFRENETPELLRKCSPSQQLVGESLISAKQAMDMETSEMLNKGLMEYGCSHYRRRCRIRAPCCNEIFDCRHCHNEAKNNINVERKLRHDMPRHQVRQVICSLCGTEQDIIFLLRSWKLLIWCTLAIIWINTQYYLFTAMNRFNNFVSAVVYAWGNTSVRLASCLMMIYLRSNIIVMVVGSAELEGVEISFTVTSVGQCIMTVLFALSSLTDYLQYLFESRSDVTVMPCGHTIHENCLKEMREHYQYACPLCSKSVCDMSKVWEKYDTEIAATPMPEPYQNKLVCYSSSLSHYNFKTYPFPEDTDALISDRFGSFAMTAGRPQKYNFILLVRNARIANPIILAKQEAEKWLGLQCN